MLYEIIERAGIVPNNVRNFGKNSSSQDTYQKTNKYLSLGLVALCKLNLTICSWSVSVMFSFNFNENALEIYF